MLSISRIPDSRKLRFFRNLLQARKHMYSAKQRNNSVLFSSSERKCNNQYKTMTITANFATRTPLFPLHSHFNASDDVVVTPFNGMLTSKIQYMHQEATFVERMFLCMILLEMMNMSGC